MVNNSSQHFERHSLESSPTSGSLNENNEPVAREMDLELPLTEEQEQANHEAELQRAKNALASIDTRLQDGTGQSGDPKARDEAMIEVVFLERKLQGNQWQGAEFLFESNPYPHSQDNSAENTPSKEG